MGTNYKHLSCEERAMIQLSLEQGCTLRTIAQGALVPVAVSRGGVGRWMTGKADGMWGAANRRLFLNILLPQGRSENKVAI
jgi:hypothetical protein